MKFNQRFMIFIMLLFFIVLITSEAVMAIPAFARRYNISCNTCHAPFPRLKPYGDDFAGDGFIIKEDEKERDYVTAGDDLMWLNKEFPLAVRIDAYAVKDDNKPAKNDLQIPYGLKLLSGGTLYKNIGYYFYFYMSERGDVAGVEDAYIHFNDLAGVPLDVMVGQFQTCDPLMKRELRLTFEDYEIYKYLPGQSGTNLTYDRGLMVTYGIEKTGTDLLVSLTNGNGINEADSLKKFDDNNYKNIGVRLNQGIGEFLSIGGYFYRGKEVLSGYGQENEVTYLGPDLNFTLGPVQLTAQYLQREDTNPMFLNQAEKVKTKGMVLETIFAPHGDRSRLYFTALYNDIKQADESVYQTATLSGSYLLSRNLRGVVEYTRDLKHDKNRFVVGMVAGM
ncbi:hypothetical protein JXO59_02005 [candidate division KSB1 bacterium]|nr:hypothetical protein [candidate division KSB1 bacterium]